MNYSLLSCISKIGIVNYLAEEFDVNVLIIHVDAVNICAFLVVNDMKAVCCVTKNL